MRGAGWARYVGVMSRGLGGCMLMTSVADQSLPTDVESGQGEREDVMLREYESGKHLVYGTRNREVDP